jgi:hypothetical protein
MTDARIAEARARCIRGTDAESQLDEDAPITSAMGKLVEASVLSPHTAASYIEDLECLLTHIRADLPAALDDLAELRERVRLLEAVAVAAWQEREAQRHFIATRALPCRPVPGEQLPPLHPLLQAWCAATEATTAALAAAGYGKEASDAHA